MDPGTLSLDLVGLQDGEPFLRSSFPTSELAEDHRPILRCLEECGPLDLVSGPSGYGLPLVRIADLGERDLRLLLLTPPGAPSPLMGLGALIRSLRDTRLPVVFTPGVVHLATVPSHRKVNRIDLGTADKVAALVFAIHDQALRLNAPYSATSFVLAELGGAFTAVLSVQEGRIVSGQGGSSGPLGFRAGGAWDAEAAAVLGPLDKRTIFSGGAASVAGNPEMAPETLPAREDPTALRALVEGVVRSVAGELAILGGAREILLSGRLCRVPGLAQPIAEALDFGLPVRTLTPPEGAKEAAFGAAMMADGLAGGRFRELVLHMGIPEASGTVLDHLYLEGAREQAARWLSAS